MVKVMVARGFQYPELGNLLRELYFEVATTEFGLRGKKPTDSRISLLTGIHRKEVRALGAKPHEDQSEEQATAANPLSRVVALWLGGAEYLDPSGDPLSLPRTARGNEPSFESLVAAVSRDMHARTILDELQRLGLIEQEQNQDSVKLTATAFVPNKDDDALLGFFGANLGDHVAVAADNLIAAPEPGPFFERAVFYNQLSVNSLDRLEKRARDLQTRLLTELNAEAMELQQQDSGDASAVGRFRCGAFVYRSPADDGEPQQDET